MPEYISWTTRVVVAGQQFRKQQAGPAGTATHIVPVSAVCPVSGPGMDPSQLLQIILMTISIISR